MRRLLLSFLIICGIVAAQQTVNLSDGPAIPGWTKIYSYDGSDNLEYVCYARPGQRLVTFGVTSLTMARSDSSLTNIVDSSNTSTATTASAHNLPVGATVVVSGATVDTDLNDTYLILTVPSSTTFTFTTADVSDATFTETTLQAVAHSGSVVGLIKIVDSSTTGTATTSAAHGLKPGNQVVITGADEVTFARTDSTLTNITVSTDVATVTTAAVHNLVIGNPVVVSGATVDTDLNGTYTIATVPTSKTFTFATSSVANSVYVESTLKLVAQDDEVAGTYVIQTVGSTTTFTITTADVTDGTFVTNPLDTSPMQFTTRSPRTTQPIWSIQRYQYSDALITVAHWAGGGAPDAVCDDRASLAYK